MRARTIRRRRGVSRRAQGVGQQPAAQLAASRAGFAPYPTGTVGPSTPTRSCAPGPAIGLHAARKPAGQPLPCGRAQEIQRTLVSAEEGGGCEAVGLFGPESRLPRGLAQGLESRQAGDRGGRSPSREGSGLHPWSQRSPGNSGIGRGTRPDRLLERQGNRDGARLGNLLPAHSCTGPRRHIPRGSRPFTVTSTAISSRTSARWLRRPTSSRIDWSSSADAFDTAQEAALSQRIRPQVLAAWPATSVRSPRARPTLALQMVQLSTDKLDRPA